MEDPTRSALKHSTGSGGICWSDLPREQTHCAVFALLCYLPIIQVKSERGLLPVNKASLVLHHHAASPSSTLQGQREPCPSCSLQGNSSRARDAQSSPWLWPCDHQLGVNRSSPPPLTAKGGILQEVGSNKADLVSSQCIFKPKFAKYIGSHLILRE